MNQFAALFGEHLLRRGITHFKTPRPQNTDDVGSLNQLDRDDDLRFPIESLSALDQLILRNTYAIIEAPSKRKDYVMRIISFQNRSLRVMIATGLAMAVAVTAYAKQPQLETIAELPIRPGNVIATDGGRVFSTVHPFDRSSGLQLIEVTGRTQFRPWPTPQLQNDGKQYSEDKIDSPLGIYADSKHRIWISDMGFHLGKTRIWAFDAKSGNEVHRLTLPVSVAPSGSILQDLVVDDRNGWIFLADIANPGLIAVEISTGKSRRFGGHSALQSDPKAEMRINGRAINFGGKPAQVGVNPLTLSADMETLYFGAMTGLDWYSVPARLFRVGADDATISQAIKRVGPKPVSDGAATDSAGNHYFTNLNENGIDRLSTQGTLEPVVRDKRLDWPDSAHFGDDGWLYIAANQLYLTPPFSGKTDSGKAPYLIVRMRIQDSKQ